MNLNVETWHEFKLSDLFEMQNGFFNNKPETIDIAPSTHPIPFLGATAENNGITGYCGIESIRESSKTGETDNTLEGKLFAGNCITITNNGSVCHAYYQPIQFTSSHDETICVAKFDLNLWMALFICTIINQERYKWSYGRKLHDLEKSKNIFIKLPIQYHLGGTPVIDPEKKFSKDGYIPDWQFMEDYIKSLHCKPLTTSRAYGSKKDLNVANWKEFQLSRICHIDFGNKFDNDKMTHETPSVNFVSRTADNNGVSDVVDRIEGTDPYPAGCLSVALGGSIGSCFLQKQPFYTGQNVAVLIFPSDVSMRAKLFFSQVFMFEVKGKFVAFGRELNKHLKTDLTLYLPILHHSDGTLVIDPEKKYSKEGYIPDWQFMEDYINSLPYSDKIK